MIRAIKDTNTGYVYEWVRANADGTETWVNVPSSNWKREQDWTFPEVEALFSSDQDSLSDDVEEYLDDDSDE